MVDTASTPTVNPPTAVSVVGLGPMGAALAKAFVGRGHPTTVWNRTAAKAEALEGLGATVAPDVAQAVSASELTVLCLADASAAAAILDDARPALSGRTVVNLGSSTPDEARALVEQANACGAGYLDGAIMVPPPAIGEQAAVCLYSGDRAIFDAHADTLRVLAGDARFLGADPGLAVLYNTALLGFMWAAVDGYLHANALVGSAGAAAEELAPIALDWFFPSVVAPILHGASGELDEARYPGEAGTVRMNLTAAEHLRSTSAAQGVSTHVPEFLVSMLEQTIASGHGESSYMSMVELFRRPS